MKTKMEKQMKTKKEMEEEALAEITNRFFKDPKDMIPLAQAMTEPIRRMLKYKEDTKQSNASDSLDKNKD